MALAKEQALYFKRMFRHARATAMDDAEGFQEIAFSVERIGMTLFKPSGKKKKALGIGDYKEDIKMLISNKNEKDFDNELFGKIYELCRTGRNSALHQGAYARNLTRHFVELSLLIEEGVNRIIMEEEKNFTVEDLMVSAPITAEKWMLLNMVRQQMLAYSFSYLPLFVNGKWQLLSENNIVSYLGPEITNRNRKLAQTIDQALDSDEAISLIPAETCNKSYLIKDLIAVFKKNEGKPVLVVREHNNEPEQLIGMITPFDLL